MFFFVSVYVWINLESSRFYYLADFIFVLRGSQVLGEMHNNTHLPRVVNASEALQEMVYLGKFN